ncbi:unnamed protein product [Adineta ricciae]|uniref:Uncharacterized protein n=1 Tax=Adineta ricciae TaxID=249248 RepID=A0A814ULU4_ADIRI|nr:unnamed protein product [Adineta ricciae]
MFRTSLFVLFISSMTILYAIPCPRECLCKPLEPLSYQMDCTKVEFKSNTFIYRAEQWEIDSDKTSEDVDDEETLESYTLSIDLSNSTSLKKFTNQTIDFTGFKFVIQSLSLANQQGPCIITSNSFKSSIYETLNALNLSFTCTKQIPNDCPEIFRPLKKLQTLDLSGSDMYKTCLNKPDTFSYIFDHLILRNNVYERNAFTSSSGLFDGVKKISQLDLQNSRFQSDADGSETCLFDIFPSLKVLDLSNIQSDDIDINTFIERLLKCDTTTSNKKPLEHLSLRSLKLSKLPAWLASESFTYLSRLDLSYNYFHNIDLQGFIYLRSISLAYNPIEFDKILWRNETVYRSINLRSTVRYSKFDLVHHLNSLLDLAQDIDYSQNQGEDLFNVTQLSIQARDTFLNFSRMNIKAFGIDSDTVKALDVSSNYLTNLDLSQQRELKYLDCSNQTLQTLSLRHRLSTLRELRCSNNNLTVIGNFLSISTSYLEVLDLSNNGIDSLRDYFTHLKSRTLRQVNFRSNFIRIVRSKTFHRDLVSLVEIDLSWNQIEKIEKNAFQARNLQILDLTGNSLKTIEPNAIFTASLRYFYISSIGPDLTDRCLQTKSKDPLLSLYFNWYRQNATLMKKLPVKFSSCLTRYLPESKLKRLTKKTKQMLGIYGLWIIVGLVVVVVILALLRHYRNTGFPFFRAFRKYKKVERQELIENEIEMAGHSQEDDIVMNMEELPYNKYNNPPRTDV